MENTFSIRPALLSDVEELVRLSLQLGNSAEPAEIYGRLSTIQPDPRHVVLVAAQGSILAGWIHVQSILSLESGVGAEISGLVVDQKERRKGVGSLLVLAAEKWAITHNLKRVRVRTNQIRTDAVAFYSACGFSELKKQLVLLKVISS